MPRWTPELIAQLRSLAAEDRTRAEIAEIMVINRNQVIGASHRYNVKIRNVINTPMTHRTYQNRVARTLKPTAQPAPKPPKAPQPVRRAPFKVKATTATPAQMTFAPVANLQPLLLTMFELEASHCRYTYGEQVPYLYCGHPVQEGSSLCPTHHASCRVKPRYQPGMARPWHRFVA